MLDIIYSKVVSCQYNNPLVSYFRIKKSQKLVAKKYFLPIFYWDVNVYVKSYNVCLALKAVLHKPYRNL